MDFTSITLATHALVLGDDRCQLGELTNLMPDRVEVARPGLGRQRGLAVRADRAHIRHDRVDPLGREAMMSRMSLLTTRPVSARGLDHRLGGTQGIGRTGNRGVGRGLIQPFLEVPDEGFKLGEPIEELSALGTSRY